MRRRTSPVLIIILLLIVVIVIGIITFSIRRNTPTQERMDAAEYYGVTEEDTDIPLIFDTEILEERGLVDDSGTEVQAFVPMDVVTDYLNDHFYWDSDNEQLLYTTPTEKYTIDPDSSTYLVNDEKNGRETYTIFELEEDMPYINIQFVQKFSDIDYALYDQPYRLVVEYTWNYMAVTTAEEETAIRFEPDIKSDILTTAPLDTQLRLVERQEDWEVVATPDGFIGYVRFQDLTGEPEEVEESRDFVEPEYTSQRREYEINLAWHQVASEEGNQTLAETLKGVSGVNVISPTWFSIKNADGDITNFAVESYVTRVHKRDMEVWALVDNFSESIDTYQVLSDSDSRVNLENNLIEQALRFDLEGLNIDFENMDEETIPHFIQFLREMSILCRKEGLVLSVDDPPPENYTVYYDRSAQAEVVDYVIMMGYDEHYQGSEEAGSVASFPWVEQGVLDTLEEVPSEELILGIPFYTRIWYTQNAQVSSEAVGMDEAADFVKSNHIETYWSETCQQNYGEYEGKSGLYQIWLEDADSIAVKLQLIDDYHLAGVAEWKLGFENSAIWSTITDAMH